MTQKLKNRIKLRNFMLDVLFSRGLKASSVALTSFYRGLGISKLQFLIQKYKFFQALIYFFNF
jgi:hypothetical protein